MFSPLWALPYTWSHLSPASPLHSGLIVQLVLVQAALRVLGQGLPDALQDALPLIQGLLHLLLQESTMSAGVGATPSPRDSPVATCKGLPRGGPCCKRGAAENCTCSQGRAGQGLSGAR